MEHKTKSIRAFIGAKDFNISRQFYNDLGFEELRVLKNMSFFKIDSLGFYLQDAYVKDWVDNTMIFLEVDSVERYKNELLRLDLHNKYDGVRLSEIHKNDWGDEIFMHDPSGILWHFGEFH